MFSIYDIIDLAIQIEQNGEIVYRKAQACARKASLVKLLGWLADQEKEHAEWFQNLRATLPESNANPIKDEMSRAFLGDILGKQTFSLTQEEIAKMDDAASIVALSLEFEKDTILFYEMMRTLLASEAERQKIDTIIAEEKAHIQTLQKLLENGAQ